MRTIIVRITETLHKLKVAVEEVVKYNVSMATVLTEDVNVDLVIKEHFAMNVSL